MLKFFALLSPVGLHRVSLLVTASRPNSSSRRLVRCRRRRTPCSLSFRSSEPYRSGTLARLTIRTAVLVVSCILLATHASAQTIRSPGSPNLHVLAHIPLGRAFTVAGIEVEQDLARPYA